CGQLCVWEALAAEHCTFHTSSSGLTRGSFFKATHAPLTERKVLGLDPRMTADWVGLRSLTSQRFLDEIQAILPEVHFVADEECGRAKRAAGDGLIRVGLELFLVGGVVGHGDEFRRVEACRRQHFGEYGLVGDVL